MNLLTRNTDYAVRALIYMAGKVPARVSARDIGRDLGLPGPFMRKTLQVLQKAGYLISTKGKSGGFELAQDTKKIRLVDLVTLFQGPVSMGDCLFKKKICSGIKSCPLRREILDIEALVLERLQGVTVASLIKG
ncbi:MAG: Rrf2 family transcriptional regulator [Candidatus Omnitrophica bacterium]|nr:Rrf2 family transcriptional regulator [Candidatus Omnitrophota bacterium]